MLIMSLQESSVKVLGDLAQFDVTGFPLLFGGGKKSLRFSFIYPAVGERGGCFNLFKVLQSNFCKNDCFYCANRKSRNCIRRTSSPEQLARLFLEYYRKGWVKGLFLSSGIYPSADTAQERMLETITILRKRYGYQGYIHFKILPGADLDFIPAAGKLADRLSINLEAAGASFLKDLSPNKNYNNDLLLRLKRIVQFDRRSKLASGVTTQLVVGASKERDEQILSLTQNLYREFNLRRVYYSSFIPIHGTPLENQLPSSPLREVRLYQADFLIRKYGFDFNELIFENGNLSLEYDPKMNWALHHLDKFPIEINNAGFEQLLRIPGVGRISAKRIIDSRRQGKPQDLKTLQKFGVVTKRARNFITLNGKYFPSGKVSPGKTVNKQLFLWEEI